MPTAYLSSKQVYLLKLCGFLFMTIDHIGLFLFPELIVFRLIGRLAFPCFLISVSNGVQHTRSLTRYAGRLALMGLLAMPVSPILFNIGFSLAVFVLSVKMLREHNKLMFGLLFVLSGFVEYSFYGFLLGWLIHILITQKLTLKWGLTFWFVLHVVFMSVMPLQWLTLGVWPLLVMTHRTRRAWVVPRAFGYLYYPVHFVLLTVLAFLLI